ncbi:ferri-bacillibactin esterase [Fusarium langsethiae]|uniref:Ferri-bacillibactin esterase n=1 Tax=Fusarium langsethiae TaxID=179993 RepID=A0A0M9ELL2_FUSLA|nr:ferri-bacillibactin esterase [Fusarium langsethiae]GKU12515.1 unnamed protein product [Fusarium langsethiae]
MTLVQNSQKHANAPNSCQFTLPTRRGEYLIQVSWPLCWSNERAPPENDTSTVSTVYIVDGNAYFFTATDIARRLELTHHTRVVLVAIGYPNKTSVFDKRRNGDLTPEASDGIYSVPPGPDGKPSPGPFGGASDFLDIIHNQLGPYIEETLFPNVPLNSGPKALFGHSYGGLFTLNALFTQPDSFDTFIVASPSIWFNNKSIVHNQERDFQARVPPTGRTPRLLVMFGGAEQTLIKLPGESDEKFDKKQKGALERKMKDNALDLVDRMKTSKNLRDVWQWEFEAEDHGGAAPCALQKGLFKFLLDQRAE